MPDFRRDILKKMILEEYEKIVDEDRLYSDYDSVGMLSRHDDPHREMMSTHKHDDPCMKCGNIHMAIEPCPVMTDIEVDAILEVCGCGTAPKIIDHDLDDDFIPDHMTPQGGHDMNKMQDAMFDRFPRMKNIDIEFDYKHDNHHVRKKHHKGAYMAKTQLYKVANYAQELYHMIPDGYNLTDWMRTKLAQASDDISDVYHALEHDDYEGDL